MRERSYQHDFKSCISFIYFHLGEHFDNLKENDTHIIVKPVSGRLPRRSKIIRGGHDLSLEIFKR